MEDYEYEEENLDDFMISASTILSEENNPERETMIESLKQHLSSIFNNQLEMQNFYKTLNLVIFNQNTKKIKNKQGFKLYPVIFSFNPNSSFYHIDYFLSSLNQTILEEYRSDFAYFSIIFSEVVVSFFADEKTNTDIINKNFLLENNKKYKLYEKLLNYCNEKIKTNEKTPQTFGCLLLTELIEKCPIVKEEKYLDSLFKILSDYLEDRWFECKLDLLNCTISLIFISEERFKPYANICLLKVLDYLTDEEWMKRKLAINIVYTLIFYCREEVMSVKDNFIEFLNTLKEDPVEEVKDVCLQTLKFIEENEQAKESGPSQVYANNSNENKNGNNKSKKINPNINRTQNKKENNKISTDDKTANSNIDKNKGNYEQISNFKINKTPNRLIMKQKASEDYIKKKLLKEKKYLEKKEKELNEKTKSNIDISYNENQNENNPPKKTKSIQKSNKTTTISKKIKNVSIPGPKEQNDNPNNIVSNNNRISSVPNINENELNNNEILKSTLSGIIQQLNKIQEGQSQFLIMLNNLQKNINNNYFNLNHRISALENYYSENNSNNNGKYKEEINDISPKKNTNILKENKNISIDEIKNKFIDGQYNEALLQAKQNEKFLFKILSLVDKNIIPKIDSDNLDDIINILNKKLSVITLGTGRSNINDILSFYSNLVKKKINLKLITQLNIKDSLEFFKNKNGNKLLKSDMNNVDIILKALKV